MIRNVCDNCGCRFERAAISRGEHVFCTRRCYEDFRAIHILPMQQCAQLSTEDAATLAGFIDGEGHITLFPTSPRCIRAFLYIGLRDERVVRWFRTVTGVGSVWARPGNAKHSVTYHWKCCARAAAGVMRQILRFLLVKHEQAQLALKVENLIEDVRTRHDPTWQKDAIDSMRKLNRRGRK